MAEPALVKQRTDTDCVLCCIAMATGRTYEDVVASLGDLAEKFISQGADSRDDQKALEMLGYVKGRDFMFLMIMPEYVGLGFLRSILWGRRAIIGAKSKNTFGLTHALYWTGTELCDPCAKRTYLGFGEVEPIDIIIFSEPVAHRSITAEKDSLENHDAKA